jgi:outer membrane protein assembly factor BamB
MEILDQARALDAAGNAEESYTLMQRLVREYGETEAAAKAIFPLRIESEPAGAVVTLNGVERGVTPLVIHVAEGQPAHAELRLPGHRTYTAAFTSADGPIARRTLSRREAWKRALPAAVKGPVALLGAHLLVAGTDGTLRQFSVRDGTPKRSWRVPGATDIVAGPTVAGSMIVFATNDGRVCCVDPPGRLREWYAGGLITSALLPAGPSGICFGTSTRRIRCISLENGSLVWEAGIPAPATPRAAAAGRALVFLCRDNRLRALDRKDGTLLWEREVPPRTSLSASGDLLFVAGTTTGTLLHAETGRERWRVEFDAAIVSACYAHPSVWVSLEFGLAIRLDARTGLELYQNMLEETVGQWVPAGASLGASLTAGGLRCVHPLTLAKLWYSHSEEPISALAGTEKRLYAVAGGRTVFCFDLGE